MISKEENVLELFFESPTREWHFEELLREAGIARSKAGAWLKKFVKEKLVKRVKEKGRMPYYTGNYESPPYQNRKKIFALEKLYQSGLLNHLSALQEAKAVIIFGSFSRWDWHKGSDIDLFIYGHEKGLKIAEYELKLNREIQPFICRDKKELEKLGTGLVKNIIKGILIKGDLDFIKVGINA
ncbi:MAG: nucleotidyltransferase domain-containing protein [Candidatus Woesearchaeota archaeon]